MKTISGKLVSVQPISLSKASRYISDFASFENNGVSEVVSIYLNRASQAFGSLVQLHKDIKNPQSSHKKHKQKSVNDQEYDNIVMNPETLKYHDGRIKSRRGDEDMGASKKKRKEKEGVEVEGSVGSKLRKGGENGDSVEDENMVNGFVEQKSRKKARKEEEENENVQEDLKVEVEHKKKKRKKREEIEKKDMKKEGKLEETESKKKKKKRGEIDVELKENSVEPIRKKRKRSKVSNAD